MVDEHWPTRLRDIMDIDTEDPTVVAGSTLGNQLHAGVRST